jgi:hypothetical protein
MATIEERRAWRDDYMVALYELSDGSQMTWPTHREIAQRSGIPEDEIFNIGQFLSDSGLAELRTFGGLDGAVSITTPGIARAEQVIGERGQLGGGLTP